MSSNNGAERSARAGCRCGATKCLARMCFVRPPLLQNQRLHPGDGQGIVRNIEGKAVKGFDSAKL